MPVGHPAAGPALLLTREFIDLRLERVEDALSLCRVLVGRDDAGVAKQLKLCQSLLDRLRSRGACTCKCASGLPCSSRSTSVVRRSTSAGSLLRRASRRADPGTAQFWVGLIAAVAALGFATARRCRVTRASFPRRLVGVTGGLAVFLEKIADVERESRVIDIEFDPSRNAG